MARDDGSELEIQREPYECPKCGSQGAENPVLDGWYECNRCVIAFNEDGEVSTSE